MRRLLAPRLWSFETRVVTLGLVPLAFLAVFLTDTPGQWSAAYTVLLAVRWFVVAPWARRRARTAPEVPPTAR